MDLEATAAMAMTCRSSGILKLQVVQVGLHVRDINFTVTLADYLGSWDHLRWLHRLLSSKLGNTRARVSLGLGCCSLHDLADLVGCIRRLDPHVLGLLGQVEF